MSEAGVVEKPMRVLGVIPARGGSKGVPLKNIRPLGGRPLIAWTIEAAAGSALDRCVVSTDSDEVAEAAEAYGGEVPFRRPADLAQDTSPAIPNMQHAVRTTEELEGSVYDAIMMLQPTTPFRTSADIDGALGLLGEAEEADSVISVVDVGAYHPARMKYLREGRLIDPPFCEAVENQNRQELEPMYIRNGAIYLTRRETLLGGSFKGRDCRAWIMPPERSVNIDTEADFRRAEWELGLGSGP